MIDRRIVTDVRESPEVADAGLLGLARRTSIDVWKKTGRASSNDKEFIVDDSVGLQIQPPPLMIKRPSGWQIRYPTRQPSD